jgi:hypothetical protein
MRRPFSASVQVEMSGNIVRFQSVKRVVRMCLSEVSGTSLDELFCGKTFSGIKTFGQDNYSGIITGKLN